MAKSIRMLAECLCLLFLTFAAGSAQADEGEEVFKKLCASCHTIGGGDTAGPDLKGVTAKRSSEWLVRVITEPEKLSAEQDPTQVELVQKYGMEMPNLGVSRADAQKIIIFLKAGESGEAAPAAGEEAAPAPAPVAVTPELLSRGKALFTGRIRFANGGAPCASCHDMRYGAVHGGSYAGDLTDSYQKMGDSGMRGVLQSLSFPAMRRIYAERPLKPEEVEALTALFKDASTPKEEERSLFPLGGVGFFALFVVSAILIKRRIR